MKKLFSVLLVGMLLAGCGGEEDLEGESGIIDKLKDVVKEPRAVPGYFSRPIELSGKFQKGATVVVSVSGEVSILESAISDGNESEKSTQGRGRSAKANEILAPGDLVLTGAGSEAILLCSNGSTVTIGAGTRMRIDGFAQEPFEGSDQKVGLLASEISASKLKLDLEVGKLIIDVKKLKKESSLIISTSMGIAGVRGTLFGVVAKNDLTEVAVMSGSVDFLDLGETAWPIAKDTRIVATKDALTKTSAIPAADKKRIKAAQLMAKQKTADFSLAQLTEAFAELNPKQGQSKAVPTPSRLTKFSLVVDCAACGGSGCAECADKKPAEGKNNIGLVVPQSMGGRCGKLVRKAKLLEAQTQNPEAIERAVNKSLDWLTLNQNADGSWGETCRGAMTGFALLCYLGHCELSDSPNHGAAVSKGIKFLVELGDKKNGWLYATNSRHGGAYAHGIATHALAESYAMMKQEFILPVLTKAVHHIVAGQKKDGGWCYLETRTGADGLTYFDYKKNQAEDGDTSVSGWQFQALRSAYHTGTRFPGVEPALEAAVKNFYRVYSPKSGRFGYRKRTDASVKHKLTGIGALGLQTWEFGHNSAEERKEVLKKAIQQIKNGSQGADYNSEESNLYSWYYDTQALFKYGGANWVSWNNWMEPMLLKAQSNDGSWPVEGSGLSSKRNSSSADAAIYRTTLCTLMLEVCYRYGN